MWSVETDEEARAELRAGLDEIVRAGARRMLAAALEAEADAYVAALVGEVDEHGHRLVVRNGRARERTVTTVAGAVAIAAPRVHDRRVDPASGQRRRFRSAIVPPWCRKSPKVAELLPLLYLHGLSSGDFVPALTEFFGSGAGLSAAVVTRLTKQWQDERKAFAERSLGDTDYVYIWADGIVLQRAPRGGAVVLPGDRRRARRRDQGAGRHRQRVPGVDRVVGRPAARPQAARAACAGARRR